MLTLSAMLVVACHSQPARASVASWQFAPAEAPPPPSGAKPAPYPVPLGEVGDIEFWAPNRGLLITGGNSIVQKGVYAYDGVSWHQLSTVCGGGNGRIAWAGPDEFWTVSDQRPGQVLPNGGDEGALRNVSLCHFENGQVVGSYAMPLEQSDSYEPMDAAACDSPDDCWFGGARDTQGAFHLHWNGSQISVVNAPQEHAIAAMAVYQEVIYESVQLAPGDSYAGEESANPILLHTIVPGDSSEYFHDVFPSTNCAILCRSLPEYGTTAGKRVAPVTLAGFALSSSWSPANASAANPELWAVAGEDNLGVLNPQQEGEGRAHPIALRYASGTWTQVVPNLATFGTEEEPIGVAAEPGESAAWVIVRTTDQQEAHVARVLVEGSSSAKIAETDVLGAAQGVGPPGSSRAIACPAPHECWLATSEGWLFHLTEGTQLPKDTDPFFDGEDGVIEYRPPDDGVPVTLPFEPPEDDSLANQQPPPPPPGPSPKTTKPKHRRARRLVTHVRERMVGGYTLRLTFTLAVRAHVHLIASRLGRAVASSRRATLAKGQHSLTLRLNPERWPTKLDLHAKALGQAQAPAASSGSSEENTIGT